VSEIWSFGADELARRIRQRQLSSKEERAISVATMAASDRRRNEIELTSSR
jgi:hypothetical protein